MARLPRLVVPDHAHYLIQRGHPGRRVFVDQPDRQAGLAALREAAAATGVRLHAWALLDDEMQLLATPPDSAALSRFVQVVGRRYVSAYNRRHGLTGTLWEGRFRCAVVEPGATLRQVLLLVDGAAADPGVTSAHLRLGSRADPLLVDLPEYWQLGNTPFEREAAYRSLLAAGLPASTAESLRRAAWGGWALGSAVFVAALGARIRRPMQARRPGRPRRAAV